MKKIIKIIIVVIICIVICLSIIPFITIDKDNKLIYINYDGDISKYDNNHCYHENVSYNEKRDISITNIDIKKYFIFYLITLEYEKGNLCDYEYVLEEEYINNFINNAEIIDNKNNIDIQSLIKDKTAIIGNTKYLGNDYENAIYYKLNNKEEVMYVFYKNDLLVIQVGSPDENTKFIAYK